ncbi:MAG: hypothetical protein RL726_832 [Actinomycetota bacterium]|jgi:hypothetical protein
MIVLDSGGVTKLSERSLDSLALLKKLRELDSLFIVPSVVLVESLHGNSPKDANTLRFLRTCVVEEALTGGVAKRAAELRRLSGHGSVVDAVVIAFAEPGGTVVSGDRVDMARLADRAHDVQVIDV